MVNKTRHPGDLTKALRDLFPPLNATSFDIMRAAHSDKSRLVKIEEPQGGYTSEYMADRSGIGQAMMYIRPHSNLKLVSLANYSIYPKHV